MRVLAGIRGQCAGLQRQIKHLGVVNQMVDNQRDTEQSVSLFLFQIQEAISNETLQEVAF